MSLLNKSPEILSEEQVREILAQFETPYRDVTEYGKSPKIRNNPENRTMVEWLEKRQIISSWKPTLTEKELRIHTFKSKQQEDRTH
ncbi:MAG: hypothetical protein ABJN52_01090 [Litorimonas sp.]